MKAVDFYKLPRPIQERFVGSVRSGFPPAPILVAKGSSSPKLVWLALSGANFALLVVVARLGFGALDSGLSVYGVVALVLFVAFAFGGVFGLAQAWAQVVRERALPYEPGVYLFPACVIDARRDRFAIYATQDLTAVNADGAEITLAFGGGARFTFPALGGAAAAQQLVADVHAARDQAMRARATEDPGDLVAVDPLHNPRFSSPVGPRESYVRAYPLWGRFGWAVAIAAALVVGPAAWGARNAASDKTMYARATKANDTTSYRAYLKHGVRFKDEVAGVLLPRAELREAEHAGTEALLRYKAEHSDSKISADIARSIRTAMLRELDAAKAQRTLAALDQFAKRYPEHGVEPELQGAVHAVFARELEAYTRRSAARDKGVVAFVERLFAWAEKHGGRVEIRFRRKKSETLGRADQAVLKTPTFMGEISYPTKYFDSAHATRRETALGKRLASELDAGLGAELFDFVVGDPVPEGEALPEPKVPTLFVTHTAEWSGHLYTNPNRPRGTWAGIVFPFDASFVIPGDKGPVKVKLETMRPAAIAAIKGDDPPPPGPAEEKLYETMATEALDQLDRKLVTTFVK